MIPCSCIAFHMLADTKNHVLVSGLRAKSAGVPNRILPHRASSPASRNVLTEYFIGLSLSSAHRLTHFYVLSNLYAPYTRPESSSTSGLLAGRARPLLHLRKRSISSFMVTESGTMFVAAFDRSMSCGSRGPAANAAKSASRTTHSSSAPENPSVD